MEETELPLEQLDARHFGSEHGFYLIPAPGTVEWPRYDSLYSEENVERRHQELQRFFPGDYDAVAVFIGGLEPTSYRASSITTSATPGARSSVRTAAPDTGAPAY